MIKALFLLPIFITIIGAIPLSATAIQMPCSVVLEPADPQLKNAKGSALIYKVELDPASFKRTNISLLGVHLPPASSYGDYDQYEGFAYIPTLISWRFKLFPTPEDPPTWAGRFDLITAKVENITIQLRPSNSKTMQLGPSVLSNDLRSCTSAAKRKT